MCRGGGGRQGTSIPGVYVRSTKVALTSAAFSTTDEYNKYTQAPTCRQKHVLNETRLNMCMHAQT